MWWYQCALISFGGGVLMLLFGRMSGYATTSYYGIERYKYAGILIIIGVTLFIIGYRKGYKLKKFIADDVFLICPKCGEPYNSNDVTNDMCPKCQVALEEIEGFYNRHPEFKD